MQAIEWEYQGRRTRNQDGNYLSLYRKGEDGAWRLWRRIWNDSVHQTEESEEAEGD